MCIKTVTSKLYRLPYRVYCFLQKLHVTFRTLNSMFDCAPFDFDRRPLDNIQRSLLFKCHFWGIFCWIPTIWNTNFEHLKNGSEKEMQRKFKRIYEQQFMNAISIWNQKRKENRRQCDCSVCLHYSSRNCNADDANNLRDVSGWNFVFVCKSSKSMYTIKTYWYQKLEPVACVSLHSIFMHHTLDWNKKNSTFWSKL